MSNQNDNDWLKNIKAVKTWTADKKVLKTIENCKEKYGTDDPTLKDMLEALASKRDVLTTQEYGKVNFSYRKRKERSNWNYKGYRCPRWD